MTTASRVVMRGNFHRYGKIKTTRNTNTKEFLPKGFASSWLVIGAFLLVAALYLYCINSTATKGYQVKQTEKEITELQKENEQLRIKEAELKSLYNIEESSRKLNMAETTQISYLEEKSPLAMR